MYWSTQQQAQATIAFMKQKTAREEGCWKQTAPPREVYI